MNNYLEFRFKFGNQAVIKLLERRVANKMPR